MPEVDPAVIDAIDHVVENRDPKAEWDPDEMRSALMDVAKGEKQVDAVEGRDFDQPKLSKQWGRVQDKRDEIKANTGESNLFKDPVREAKKDFESFFEELNDKYEFGIRNLAIEMMMDWIEDSGELPHPLNVEKHLKQTKSGVEGYDVDYIADRYANWLENYTSDLESGGGGGMGSIASQGSGQAVPSRGDDSPPTAGASGVPIAPPGGQRGGMSSSPPSAPASGQQQGGQQHPQAAGSNQASPEVESLREEVEELKSVIASQQQQQSSEPTMTVTTDEGETIEMTVDQAEKMGYVNQDDGDDLVETVRTLRELGVVGDDSGGDMAEEIGEAIEQLGQYQMKAQQQMSENFQSVLEEMRSMEGSEDGDLTQDDVREIINDELKEDEVERLENQMEKMRSEFSSELRDAKRSNSSVMDDPEMFKTDREMQLREQQLQTMNENLQELPTRTAAAIQKGVIPLVERLNDTPGNNPLWTPPQPPQGQQQGAQPQQQRGHQPRDAGQSSTPAQQQSPPTSGRGGQEEVQSRSEPNEQSDLRSEDDSMTQESDGDDLGEYGDQVRDKLNIGDEADSAEGEA